MKTTTSSKEMLLRNVEVVEAHAKAALEKPTAFNIMQLGRVIEVFRYQIKAIPESAE